MLLSQIRFLAKYRCLMWFSLWSLVTCSYFVIFTTRTSIENKTIVEASVLDKNKKADGYLVYSPKCKILDLDPFNEEAKLYYFQENSTTCTSKKLLTYVRKTNNVATLYINKDVEHLYSDSGLSCCYSYISRRAKKSGPDDHIEYSECKIFQDNITLHHSTIHILCSDLKNNVEVYENVHKVITIKNSAKKKLRNENLTPKPLSVLMVGIDSVSHLNLIRTMPSTYRFLQENNWISLRGYNKVGDNTFPNIMAILTGFNHSKAHEACVPEKPGMLDKCPLVWYDYRDLGYITAYAEDDVWISTFNYLKKGFTKSPTDYYFRPYLIACEYLNITTHEGMPFCTGPEISGQRIMNLAKDFAVTFKDNPTFGYFWMNTFSHDTLNSPTIMDNAVNFFLEQLKDSGVNKDSLVILFSDHGMRFGPIRQSLTGWLEERLPFIYVSFPDWFTTKYPLEHKHFLENVNKLTTPYNLYMTLQHILVMSGLNYTVKACDACPNCRSLFEHIESDISCEDVGIEQHFCTCVGYKPSDVKNLEAFTAASYVLREIDRIIAEEGYNRFCYLYEISKIIAFGVSERMIYTDKRYIRVVFETYPKAVFESTIYFKGDIVDEDFHLAGDISRLDMYSETAFCTENSHLKKYCYCVVQSTST